jgi:hypothetical protein
MEQLPNVPDLVNRLASRLHGINGKRKLVDLFGNDDELRLFFGEAIHHVNYQTHLASCCGFSLMGKSTSREIMPSAHRGTIRVSEEVKTYLLRVMADYGKPKESKAKKQKTKHHTDELLQQPQQPFEPAVVLATPSAQPLLVGAMAATGGVDGENTVMHLLPSTIISDSLLYSPPPPPTTTTTTTTTTPSPLPQLVLSSSHLYNSLLMYYHTSTTICSGVRAAEDGGGGGGGGGRWTRTASCRSYFKYVC